MPHRTCARCSELSELIDALTVERASVARAVLQVQRHVAGIGEACESATTWVTGMERNGRDT